MFFWLRSSKEMSTYVFPIIVDVVGNHCCVVRAGESPTVECAELVVSSQAVVWWGSCGTSDTVYACVRVVFFSGFVGLFVCPCVINYQQRNAINIKYRFYTPIVLVVHNIPIIPCKNDPLRISILDDRACAFRSPLPEPIFPCGKLSYKAYDLTFPPLTGGCSEGLDAFRCFRGTVFTHVRLSDGTGAQYWDTY